LPCFFFYLIRSSLPSSWKSYNPNTQMPIPFRKECLLNFIYRFVKFPSVVRSPKCTQPHPNYPPQSPITTPAFEFCFRFKKKKKKRIKTGKFTGFHRAYESEFETHLYRKPCAHYFTYSLSYFVF